MLAIAFGVYGLVRAAGVASWRLGEQTTAYRWGRILYRICLGLAVFWIVIWVGRFFTNLSPLHGSVAEWSIELWAFGLPVLMLYGLGRALRYVLSGE